MSGILRTRVGVVATSSAVPVVELMAGVERLRAAGFAVRVHEQCLRQHFTFAGTDEERCAAFLEYAYADDIDVLWCGRGGYGATRILPLLDWATRQRGRPGGRGKLLVGYSDVTVLHEFARKHWGWATLHADMPAAAGFGQLDPGHWRATVELVRGARVDLDWGTLAFVTDPPAEAVEGELVGGTLTLWVALAGTSFAPDGREKILFFEDVGERWYRVDRMVTQLEQAGAFAGVRAVVLGDFKDCRDEVHMVRRDALTGEKVPLRRFYEPAEAIGEIFGGLGRRLGIPVAAGLPVGHGPNFAPLPLGGRYRLHAAGRLELVEWDGWTSD